MINPVPKSACIVALGNSALEYMQQMVGSDLRLQFDQIWTVNMGLRIFRHDVAWVMDDLRRLAKDYPDYGRLLAQHDKPIITSQAYPEFPRSITYPIQEVASKIGDDFFTNTVCYAMGWAMVSGVKDLWLFGCDFFYPKIDVREEGGMNAGYFLGLARHFGMNFHIPQSSTLLSAHAGVEVNGQLHRPLYGYAKQPLFSTGGEIAATESSTGLRAGERDNASSPEINQPICKAKKLKARSPNRKNGKGRTAPIHSGREDLRGGRSRDRRGRSTGVVLDRSEEVDPGSSGRGRVAVADGQSIDGAISTAINDARRIAAIERGARTRRTRNSEART